MIHCPSRSVALSLHWDTETNSKAATPAYKHTLIQTYILCINWGRLDRNTLCLSLSPCLTALTQQLPVYSLPSHWSSSSSTEILSWVHWELYRVQCLLAPCKQVAQTKTTLVYRFGKFLKTRGLDTTRLASIMSKLIHTSQMATAGAVSNVGLHNSTTFLRNNFLCNLQILYAIFPVRANL